MRALAIHRKHFFTFYVDDGICTTNSLGPPIDSDRERGLMRFMPCDFASLRLPNKSISINVAHVAHKKLSAYAFAEKSRQPRNSCFADGGWWLCLFYFKMKLFGRHIRFELHRKSKLVSISSFFDDFNFSVFAEKKNCDFFLLSLSPQCDCFRYVSNLHVT